MDVLCLIAREKKLDMVMKIMPETPRYVLGDEKRIRQVLLNLMVMITCNCFFLTSYIGQCGEVHFYRTRYFVR